MMPNVLDQIRSVNSDHADSILRDCIFLLTGKGFKKGSDNFQSFHFRPKLSFLRENHKNDNKVEFPDFYDFSLFMIF